MDQIIARYNGDIIQEAPRYFWYVKDASGNPIFHCEYKNGHLLMRMNNLFGSIVFNKAVIESRVQESIDFCLSYLNSYNNLA